MLSKAKIKSVQSLQDKKHRKAHSLFVAEGAKIMPDVLGSKIIVKTLFATEQWFSANEKIVNNGAECIVADEREMKQLSALQSPPEVLAVCEIPKTEIPVKFTGLTLLLDTIQDPGNLGTIIRLADWYGIEHIVCSPACADIYNPKTIQATMGSFVRVQMHYIPLADFLEKHTEMPVYGALLKGESLYKTKFEHNAFLLIGNEGNGIDAALQKYIQHPVFIPRIGNAESLNAAMAAAVICDAWARGEV